jgi:hypothetical protein
MKIPLSWLKDYIDIDLSLEELARTLTMVGLEVEEISVIGLPLPENSGRQEFKFTGLAWDPEKFIVAQINEVMPHPDADRLTLCRLYVDLMIGSSSPEHRISSLIKEWAHWNSPSKWLMRAKGPSCMMVTSPVMNCPN